MEKMYTGNLSEVEKDAFRHGVRATFADRLKVSLDRTGRYSLAMHANCAYAAKG
jgi:hypothetical protein